MPKTMLYFSKKNGPRCSSWGLSSVCKGPPSHCVVTWFFFHACALLRSLCVQISILLKTPCWIRTGLNLLFQDPVPKYSHILRSRKLWFQHNFSIHNFVGKGDTQFSKGEVSQLKCKGILILSPLSHSITLIKQLVFVCTACVCKSQKYCLKEKIIIISVYINSQIFRIHTHSIYVKTYFNYIFGKIDKFAQRK